MGAYNVRRLEWTGKGDSQNTATVIRAPKFYRKFGHFQTGAIMIS